MDAQLRDQLVASLIDNNLVFICGAGLSMCGDSDIPSAAELAEQCYDNYYAKYAQQLPEGLRSNLEGLTKHLYADGQLQRRFIPLVPWSRFRKGNPNDGHTAIADFLACRAVPLSISTNFDTLIETAANRLGEPDFCPITDANDSAIPRDHSPYLKVHGCAYLSRATTLWCREQLADEPIKGLLENAETFLRAALNGKDLVFVGFWTDWSYMNEVLETTVGQIEPNRIVLVDIAAADVVQEKAPRLWELSQSNDVIFEHVRESADEFLNQLRLAYSTNFLDRLLLHSQQAYQAHFGEEAGLETLGPWPHDINVLYGLRRDLTGAANSTPVREKDPIDSITTAGAMLIHLLRSGGEFVDDLIVLETQRIRVVAGRGVPLSIVKAQYVGNSNSLGERELVICAGATDDGDAKANVIRGEGSESVIRGGLAGRWLTLERAIDEIGV